MTTTSKPLTNQSILNWHLAQSAIPIYLQCIKVLIITTLNMKNNVGVAIWWSLAIRPAHGTAVPRGSLMAISLAATIMKSIRLKSKIFLMISNRISLTSLCASRAQQAKKNICPVPAHTFRNLSYFGTATPYWSMIKWKIISSASILLAATARPCYFAMRSALLRMCTTKVAIFGHTPSRQFAQLSCSHFGFGIIITQPNLTFSILEPCVRILSRWFACFSLPLHIICLRVAVEEYQGVFLRWIPSWSSWFCTAVT